MISNGQFYVVVIGKRYLRGTYKKGSNFFTVGQWLEHAEKFKTLEEANTTAGEIMEDWRSHAAKGGDKPKDVQVHRFNSIVETFIPAKQR